MKIDVTRDYNCQFGDKVGSGESSKVSGVQVQTICAKNNSDDFCNCEEIPDEIEKLVERLTELDQKDETNLAEEKDMILYFVIGGAVLIVIILAFCMYKVIRFYKNKSKDAVKMLIKESK